MFSFCNKKKPIILFHIFFFNREGEEWSIRRSALNKVFLKPDIINDYTEVFNQVVTDILDKWSMKMIENHVDSLLIDGLEKELYNWSIECKCVYL